MRKILVFVCALMLAPLANAGPKKVVQKVWHYAGHHKRLLATSAIYLASDFADTETTIQAQRRCPTCVETSDLYGPHPSPARLWGESAAFDAAYIWFNWFGTKDTGLTGTKDFTPEDKAKHPTLYKLVWMEKPTTLAIMAAVTAGHARAAYHNEQIPASPK